MQDKKKRSMRTTHTQYTVYVETLANVEVFRNNKFNPNNANVISTTWAELTNKLNSCGGPQRSTKQWKKVLSDWRCTVKKKARLLKNNANKTGGGPPPDSPLTDLENKLIDVLGHVVIDGFEGVAEIGLPQDEIENQESIKGIQRVTIDSETILDSQKAKELRKEQKILKPSLKPYRKKSTLLGSIKEHLKKYSEKDYSNMLQEININLATLIKIENSKLRVDILKLQLKYPDIDVALSLVEDDT